MATVRDVRTQIDTTSPRVLESEVNVELKYVARLETSPRWPATIIGHIKGV
jgi:hypothetical protein